MVAEFRTQCAEIAKALIALMQCHDPTRAEFDGLTAQADAMNSTFAQTLMKPRFALREELNADEWNRAVRAISYLPIARPRIPLLTWNSKWMHVPELHLLQICSRKRSRFKRVGGKSEFVSMHARP